MVTQLLYGSVIWDDDEYYIDKMKYKGQKFDSTVSIWWEALYYPNEFLAYNICYDKDAGFIFYRQKSNANELERTCSARILYGELYSTRRDEGLKIPISDAVKLLKEHPEYFDHSENKPAQILKQRERGYNNIGRVIREYDGIREYKIPHTSGIY